MSAENNIEIDEKLTEEQKEIIAKHSMYIKEYFFNLRFWHKEQIENWVEKELYTFIYGHTKEFYESKSIAFVTDETGLFATYALLQSAFGDDTELDFPEDVIKHIENRYQGFHGNQSEDADERYFATGVDAVKIIATKDCGVAKIYVDVNFLGYLDNDFFE